MPFGCPAVVLVTLALLVWMFSIDIAGTLLARRALAYSRRFELAN